MKRNTRDYAKKTFQNGISRRRSVAPIYNPHVSN